MSRAKQIARQPLQRNNDSVLDKNIRGERNDSVTFLAH